MNTLLPRLMLITARPRMKPNFAAALASALSGGARLIQMREPDLAPEERLALAQAAKRCCDNHDARLLINGDAEVARQVGAAGLHLPERALHHIAPGMEPGQPVFRFWGASVHSLEAGLQAQSLGADYVLFGHVYATASHPGQEPRGLDALRQVCAAVSVPVYAIGGITAENARACLEAGAHGVAVISTVWESPDPAESVRRLMRVGGGE